MPVFLAPKKTVEDSGTKILDRLTAALRSDGDFPVRARVVNEIRLAANNPHTTVDQISDLILREPSLGTRVLHLVNSSFYQRSQPIVTVTQAVMQLGMKALSDLCAGFVLMQKFVPAAKRGGIFADAVKKSITTSLLGNMLAQPLPGEGLAERAYLAGTFYNLGQLLLAFYFPQVYEAAGKRAKARGLDMTRSMNEVLGISALELTLGIVDALKIPHFYRDLLELSYSPFGDRKGDASTVALADCVAAAGMLSEAIVDGKGRQSVEAVIEELCRCTQISQATLVGAAGVLGPSFRQHCALIELGFLALPDWLDKFAEKAFQPLSADEPAPELNRGFGEYLEEMKLAIEDGEPLSAVIALGMEALALGLGYDRVVVLYSDSEQTALSGRMGLGKLPKDVREFRRKLDDPESEELVVRAFRDGLPQFFGEPLFDDGFPFAAFPLGLDARRRGAVYVDRVCPPGKEERPLSEKDQAALSVMMDLLDQAVGVWE